MNERQAARLASVQPPATVAAGDRAREMARQGKAVIDLGQSSPYHDTPAHIVEAGIQALRDGFTNIESPKGLPEFGEAMAEKLALYNGLTIDPAGDVLATPGSKQGLYYALNGYVGPGDEVLLVEPTWVSFRQQVELSQGVPVEVALSEEEEYTLTYDGLRRYVTPHTKAMVINNPNNPTGRVYSQEELEAVAHVALENNILVICDETYEYFVYGPNTHVTLATLPGMWDHTLTSYTFTKSYSMAGWRLGCIVGPERLLEPLLKIHSHTASFVSPFIQKAGVAALTGPQDHIAEWRAQCEQLATQVADRLNAVPGVQCNVPQGATFLFPRYSAEVSSKDMAGLLVDQHGVVVTPGSGFGNVGERHFRVALMRSPAEQVLEGVDRLARALESFA